MPTSSSRALNPPAGTEIHMKPFECQSEHASFLHLPKPLQNDSAVPSLPSLIIRLWVINLVSIYLCQNPKANNLDIVGARATLRSTALPRPYAKMSPALGMRAEEC